MKDILRLLPTLNRDDWDSLSSERKMARLRVHQWDEFCDLGWFLGSQDLSMVLKPAPCLALGPIWEAFGSEDAVVPKLSLDASAQLDDLLVPLSRRFKTLSGFYLTPCYLGVLEPGSVPLFVTMVFNYLRTEWLYGNDAGIASCYEERERWQRVWLYNCDGATGRALCHYHG